MADVWRFFAHEDDYPDLDERDACGRLARVLAIPTVDGPTPEQTDWNAFDEEERIFREFFPHVFSQGEAERVGHSLLIRLAGSDDALRPAMFMGHMDVVPVVPGTEGDWHHGAFSGYVDDEYVWGRGALDMTDQLVGQLEALEYLLSHGKSLRRTVYVCLGQDEETYQTGACRMGRLLKERGVRLEFLVDEGDYLIRDMGGFGAPGVYAMSVNLAEKGYCDVRLTVRSAGGHSSNPFGGTSLAILAEAIDRVARDPWPVELIGLDRQTLEALQGAITEEPLRSLAEGDGGIRAHADEIATYFHGQRALFPLVTTTVAPTMIRGGSTQPNVMPQDMQATINFRLLPGSTCDDVERHVLAAVEGLPVEVEVIRDGANDPSRTSRADGYGFRALEQVAGRYFVDPRDGRPLRIVPAIATGASDARMYEDVCDSCLRFSAFVADAAEVDRGVHGTDERITRRSYLQGIRFTIALIELTCVEARRTPAR